jgi:hypothetical protein
MATVVLSQDLRERILDNAKGVFEKRLVAACESYAPDLADRLYAEVFSEYIPHMNALPEEFFMVHTKLFVSKVCDIEMPNGAPTYKHMEFSSPVRIPHGIPSKLTIQFSSYYRSECLTASARLDFKERFPEITEEILSYYDRIQKLLVERTVFRNQVKQILEANRTLAPAIKIWSPLVSLLPVETLARHRETNKKIVKEEVSIDVDLSSMTTAVVANKLSQ